MPTGLMVCQVNNALTQKNVDNEDKKKTGNGENVTVSF